MSVYCLASSHNGTILASGSTDSSTRLWNLDSYEQLFVLQGHGGIVNALDFSADDQRLFSGSNDGWWKSLRYHIFCKLLGSTYIVYSYFD